MSTEPSNSCRFVQREYRREHHLQASSLLLKSFKPLKPAKHYIMDMNAELKDINELLDEAKATRVFSLYTSRNVNTQQVNSITIEFIQIEHMESIIVTFDLMNRPDEISMTFALIKFILLLIFKPEKRFNVWNSEQKQDLYAFVEYRFLPKIIVDSIILIELQELFKKWYNKVFVHDAKCFVPKYFVDDSNYCICSHRPYKNLTDQWTLQRALYYVFNECICILDQQSIHISADIQFSIAYCMILTKLSLAIELDWNGEQLQQFQTFHED